MWESKWQLQLLHDFKLTTRTHELGSFGKYTRYALTLIKVLENIVLQGYGK